MGNTVMNVLIIGLVAAFGIAAAAEIQLLSAPATCSADVRSSINWGTATSAYQVEGAWNEDGKSPSIWDTLAQAVPSKISDNTTGNVAVDMYHRWESDIELMKQLGIKHYRLSIAWTRIIPQGVEGSPVNMAGVNWYRNLIKALLAAGIKPAVTMYHWDLPQVLQDTYGGFMSPLIQRDFLYYADTLFAQLGDLVDQWMTFNEVISICELGYQLNVFAPQLNAGLAAKYTCGHNIILAHAKAIQLYRTKYMATQKGRVSIALDGKYGWPKNPYSPADVEAAENFMVFQYAWIADPLYFGDYPKVMRDTQGADLPKFTPAETSLLKATPIDFFSVNFYCGYYISAPPPNSPTNMTFDAGAKFTSPGVPSNAPWLFKTPTGLRNTLVWLHKRYDGPEFWITENGVSGPDEEWRRPPEVLDDKFRQDYYQTYLDNLCLAKTVDGVNVRNYYAWSFLDNFEWREGFHHRFGMIYVDLEDNLKRYPKGTALWLAKYFYRANAPLNASSLQRAAALPVTASDPSTVAVAAAPVEGGSSAAVAVAAAGNSNSSSTAVGHGGLLAKKLQPPSFAASNGQERSTVWPGITLSIFKPFGHLLVNVGPGRH